MNATSRLEGRGEQLAWLLGRDPKQRIRLRHTALGFAIALIAAVGMGYGVWSGLMEPRATAILAVVTVGGILLAFVAIRLGWTRELADPSLSSTQIAWAIGCCAGGYYVAGPLRGAVFPILMVVMMFGMFRLDRVQVSRLAVGAILALGAVMTLATRADPERFPVAVELAHFLIVSTMLLMVPILGARLAALRQQRSELSSTLEQVRELAAQDALTGLANRRQMNELIDVAAASGAPFCLAVIDLDHFKNVNDEFGHGVGDEVLCEFARIALTTVRSQDVLGRWGGEEFVLLQPDTRVANAHHSVERLRESLAERPISTSTGELRITVSAGVAENRRPETGMQTLARADAALYEAKRAGRNRVRRALSPAGPGSRRR